MSAPSTPPPEFDVYLSFDARDQAEVRRIQESLGRHGIVGWGDPELRHSATTQSIFSQLNHRVPAVAIMIGTHELGSNQQEEINFLTSNPFTAQRPIILVLLANAPAKVDLPRALRDRSPIDFRHGEYAPNVELLVQAIPPRPAPAENGPYLLNWNPRNFAWSDFEGFVEKARAGGRPRSPWSTGNARNIRPDARVYLIRQGVEPRGLIGAGRVVRGSYLGEHWDEKRRTSSRQANYVEVEWDALFATPVIPREELLQSPLASPNWDSEIGGTTIDAAVASELESRWAARVAKLTTPTAPAEQTNAPPPAASKTPATKTGATGSGTITASAQGVAYKSTYAAFSSDLVAFDSSTLRAPLDDALGVKPYASHLAQLIAARATPLPISVGLFGDWGAGKSYFMRLLHQEIDGLAATTGDAFCHKIVQIHFNAWHYLDTNLWANLVCEIFDQLFRALIAREDTPNEKVEKLKQQLNEQSALADAAREALAAARLARTAAESELHAARQQRELQEKTVASFIDDLRRVVDDEQLRAELAQVAGAFGLTRLQESYDELAAKVAEVRTLGGRAQAMALHFWTAPGRWRRFALVAAVLAAPFALSAIVPALLHLADAEARAIAQSVTRAGTLILGVSTWLAAQAKRGTSMLNQLDTTFARVTAVRDRRRAESATSGEEIKLDKLRQTEADARHALATADARVRAIEDELRELAPGRRLLRFLEERARTTDYRQYLGLVSLVRKDFEQLTTLLHENRSFRDGEKPMLDRIVLYIDDLDRCRADRVIEVLEAVHLLLAFRLFAVVVAVDPRWVRRSLLAHYPRLLGAGAGEDRDGADEKSAPIATPQDYLEKIFQVPFHLQRLEKGGFEELVENIFPVGPRPAPTSTAPAAMPNIAAPNQPPRNVLPTTPPAAPAGGVTPRPNAPPPAQQLPPPPAPPVVPPQPERLDLESWEVAAIKLCHPLFRTPRAVKRLGNTYALIRVGVAAAEWSAFLGTNANPGAHRVPLLMLAVGAAFPGIARRWLHALRTGGLAGWTPPENPGAEITGEHPTRPEQTEWRELRRALLELQAETFAIHDAVTLATWAPRVARFSF